MIPFGQACLVRVTKQSGFVKVGLGELGVRKPSQRDGGKGEKMNRNAWNDDAYENM